MKMISLFVSALVLTTSFSALAAGKSTIYCKTRNLDSFTISDAAVVGWQDCQQHLMEGVACFTGSRAKVIEQINETDTYYFEEVRLISAQYKGRSEISYVWEDQPNEVKIPLSIGRCSKEFFTERDTAPKLNGN